MSLKRLKFEDLDKDKRLTDPNSKWYNKKLEFALKRLSYYMCYVCKKPYFAGRRECGDGPGVNNEDPNYKFDPKDLVCGKDANLSGVAGVTECKKHGKDFIEYKCRFVVKLLRGFVGELLIFVKIVIRDNVVVIMLANILRINYLNVIHLLVKLEENILLMEMNML